MSTSKKVRRDKIARLARAGKLVAVSSRKFDDQYGQSGGPCNLPVHINADHSTFVDGFFNITEWDLKTKSGAAWQTQDGIFHVVVHGNLSYEFREVVA